MFIVKKLYLNKNELVTILKVRLKKIKLNCIGKDLNDNLN